MHGHSPIRRAAGVAVLMAAAACPQPGSPPGGAGPLEELIALALARNPDLLAARQRLAEAQGVLRQAGLRPNPGLDISVANGDVLNSRGERQYEIAYSHTLELGGKRERRVNAAEAGTELARLEVADRERLLRADVKARYIEVLAARRNLENTRRLLELNRGSYDLARARTREGEGSPLEQGLLQVEVNRIDADRILLEGELERALLELRLAAGLDAGSALPATEPLRAPGAAIDAGRLLAEALARRPDVRAAEVQERLAGAELSLARAEASPDLVLTGRYAHTRARFDLFGFVEPGGPLAPLRDRDNTLAAGVSIRLPLRNRNQGNIEAGVARLRAARLRRQALERSVRHEVSAAANRYRAAQDALAVFGQGVIRQSEENLRIVRGAHELGELRLLDVINEQRRLLDTQRAYTALLKDANLALAEVERAAGAPLP